MSIWAIAGFDAMYGGLHGMKDIDIFEGSEVDARTYAYELSESVINSYSCIYEELEEEFNEICESEGIENGTIEADDIWNDIFINDIDYYCVELDKNKLPPSVSLDDLAKEFYEDEEEFIEKYGLYTT